MFNTRYRGPALPAAASSEDGVDQPFLSPAQLGQALGWPVPVVVRLLSLFSDELQKGSGQGAKPLPMACQLLRAGDLGFFRSVAHRLEAGEPLTAILQSPPVLEGRNNPPVVTPRLRGREQAARWGFAQYCSLHYRQMPVSLNALVTATATSTATVSPAALRDSRPRPVGIAHQNKRTPHLSR